MRPHSVSTSLLAAVLVAGAAHAQSWDQLVAQRWPGDSIRKVTEAQFDAFVQQHVAQLGDKTSAVRAFLTAQHLAYGHPATGDLWFVNRGVAHRMPVDASDAAVAEGAEPNDDPLLGGTPSLFACGDHGYGVIDAPGATYDSDWWQFTLATSQRVVIWTSRGTAATSGYVTDTILELYDGTSTLVTSDDDGGAGLYSYIDTVLAPGTYFANVRPYSTFTTVGSYGVDLYCEAPPPTPTTVAEGAEPNNDPTGGGTPTVFQVGDTGDGDLNPSGDSDWWAFTVTGALDIIAETSAGVTGTPVGDTTLRLRDAAGVELAFDDDGGVGFYSRIAFTLPAAGTYYLDVQAFGTGTGTYRLALTDASGAPVVSTYSVDATGCAGTAGTPTIGARFAEVPLVGSTFGIDVTGMPTNAPAVGNLGFTQTLPGPVPLPYDLAPLGAPGCLVSCDIAGAFPLTVDAAGNAVWFLLIPADANLVGLTFYQQVANVDSGANGLGITTSNLGTGVLGDAVQ